jgi:hypothetical protein
MKGGKPDFPALDPLFLTMPDNRYRTPGQYAGDAWCAGKHLKQPAPIVPRKDGT